MNQEPTIVGGRYELGELLGRGGMAEVRKGTDTRLGRVVAVKRLRTDLASDATFQARFRREAQSSASLNHPSIVSVYDTGEEMTDEGVAQPYIVMEYVAGRTLRDILREGRKILPERAMEITSGVLSALDYSHRAGIIHRDIKPGNVMLTPSGDVKVMDFGIARAVSDASSTMTQTAAVVGTAQYLSPEQARGETVDSRSDVYSTGCLLYELLTGRPPFVGDSPVAVAYQHVREPAVPPSHHDTALPAEVDAIVMKSLAKRVEDRYQSAASMRSDIERYLAGRPVQAPPVEVQETAYITPTPEPSALPLTEYDDDEEGGSRTGLVIFLGVLLVALIAAAAYFLPKLMESPPDQVQVPNLVDMKKADAEKALEDKGLTVKEEFRVDETVTKNHVIEQDPNAYQYVDPGSEVTIVISSGVPVVSLPDVVGENVKDAKAELVALEFDVKVTMVESDEPKGNVVEMSPKGDTDQEKGSEVLLSYSDGPEKVPDVVGMPQDQAEEILREAGFVPVVVLSDDPSVEKGLVISQTPGHDDDPQPQGTTVTIVVSSHEQPTESPSDTTSPTPTDTGSPTTLPTPTGSP
ncbi:MAG TPA: Stk1 family PASTA domain-containing Ser/Thr kinase [Nocardioides sp.]